MTSRACVAMAMTMIIVNLQLSHSSPDTARDESSQQPQQQTSARDQLPRYYRQCPSVECPPVSDDCVTVEFLVYAFQYRLPQSSGDAAPGNGRRRQTTVSVSCESCRYCLVEQPVSTSPRSRSRPRSRSPPPSRGGVGQRSSRRRRAAVLESALGEQCRPVESCPNVSTQCRDVRLTRVLFAGQTCRVPCPACYDAVLVPDQTDTVAETAV